MNGITGDLASPLSARKWSAVRLVSCLLCFMGVWSAAYAANAAAAGTGASSPSELTSTLLPPPGSPTSGEALQAAREANLASPEALAAREASRTRYENEGQAAAAQTLRETFPAVVDRQDGGPQPLVEGEKSLGFTSANVEQIDTGSGYVGVVQSLAPVAVASGDGHWAAVDLAPQETTSGFEAQRPLVAVRIPKHLAEGARIPSIGVSVTPVDANGNPLNGSDGVTDGTGVLFANTQTDADTLLKPSSFGLEASTVLRSVASPEALYYRVGVPSGARLVASSAGPGAEVVNEGVTVARIKPPVATDAAGTTVPTSMSVFGDTLVVSVNHGGGSYDYPIVLDPELSGYWQEWSNVVPGNWEFHEWIGYTYEIAGSELRMKHEPGSFQANDYALWAEKTKGYTKIFDVYVKDELYPWSSPDGHSRDTPSWLEAFIETYKAGGGTENWTELTGSPYRSEATVCGAAGCASAEGTSEGNAFQFQLTTRNAGSTGEQFYAHAEQVSTGIAQQYGKHSTVGYNTSAGEIEGTPNVLAGGGTWLGPHTGKLEYHSEDGGLGVSESMVEVKGSGGWEKVSGTNYLPTGSCGGIQCAATEHEIQSYNTLTANGAKPLSEPEAHIRVGAKSYMPYSSSSEHGEGEAVLKVDAAPPHNLTLSGLASKGEELQLGEVEAHLKVEATDGSSGVRSIAVGIDGKEIGKAGGYCSGPCTGSSEWPINGAELGSGEHKVTVVATDNAGNVSPQKEYTLNVNHAAPVAMGPGSVNPESGDFALEASDVDLSGGMGPLSVTRHYDSLNPKEGEDGPLGPQWTIALSSLASLEVLPDNSVMVVGPAGLTHFSVKEGGGFEAPEGDKNLTLEYEPKAPAYLLKNPAQGTTTQFTLPNGAPAWMPTVSDGPVATDTTTDEYTTAKVGGKTIAEPTFELAAHPAATCSKGKLEAGCRALEFEYGKETKAKGEKRGEWGEFKGRLKEVIAVAYNPSSKAMARTPVAAYEYDGQGRLRAEWNPAISPALKATYGYDSEGHVTALTPPGQESWAFTYGAISGDPSMGRLLKMTRTPTSGALWNGEATSNTAVPKVSGTPAVGVRMAVSEGTWTNAPVVYGFQWEDCNSTGKECMPISGATNANYTPVGADVGHTLVAEVVATNGGGSGEASSAASAVVVSKAGGSEGAAASPQPGSTIEYGVPLSGGGAPQEMGAKAVETWAQKDDPAYATAIFPPDEPMGWPARDYARATVYYLDSGARTVNVASPSGSITTTEYNDHNEATRTLSADNRATALNEGSKSAEVAEKLDTKTEYSPADGDITKVVGPKHKVKLASGEEVEAQSITHDYYNEGAAQAEAHNHEEYDLLTKTTTGALLSGGQEKDVRTTLTSYSGQEYLGWKLRKPTSTTTDPGGLNLVHKTIYDPTTGNAVETRSPAGNAETIYPFAFSSSFGSEGSGNGQFKHPAGSAIDAVGDVWVVDEANGRIEKFSSAGGFMAAYGSKGSGNGQFQSPWGIALNQSTGNVYVADKGNSRVEELSSSGAFVRTFGTSGSGALIEPTGDAVDSSGNVWVSDWGHNRLVEFSPEGAFIREAGSSGSGNGQVNGPGGVAISEGSVFLADYYNSRVDQFSTAGASLGQFGSKGSGAGQLKEPYAITANLSTGTLYVSDTGNNRLEEFSPAGRYLTEWQTWGPSHQVSNPTGLSIATNGKLYVSDSHGNQVSAWTPPEAGATKLTFASQFGSSGSGNGQFSTPINVALDGEGNIWATDYGNDRIEKFSAKGSFIAAYGKEGSGNGQFHGPGGIDVNQSTGNVYVADTYGARIEEFSSSGSYVRSFGTSGSGKLTKPGSIKLDSAGNVWVPDMSADRIVEFSSSGTYIAAYGKEGSGEVQFKQPTAVAFSGENVYVADSANHRVQELTNKGAFIRQFGKEGQGGGELYAPEGIAADAAGNLYVVDDVASHVEEFTPSGGYMATFATKGSGEGQLKAPIGDAIDAAGNMYVADAEDNRVEKWSTQAVHDTKTIYYSAKAEAEVGRCQNHPEWVGLPCETKPVAQPHTSELPELPVTAIEYNMWNQPEVVEEAFGSGAEAKTRTKKTIYDTADRPEVTEETSSVDLPLPKVKDKYSAETGRLIEQSTTVGETTKTITSAYNTLGRLTEYTDAAGNKATFEYEKEKDARLLKVADAKGSQTYHYAETTGNLAELVDSGAGVFKATYDVEGKMTSESYPNAMTANFARNPAGEATGIEYIKTAHCAKTCPEIWFSDTTVPSIHGEVLKQASTLSEEPSYTYDAAGRLTQVQEIPAGEGCTTRSYSYDEEGNRTSLTTNPSGAEGKCTSEGGTTERHTYDPANRMIDSGVAYETFGNTTKLPAADAGGSELVSEYYVDNQVAKQEQNKETIEYKLDPEDRTLETISKGNTSATVISHYDGAGGALGWTGEGSGEGEKWTRHIPDIGGALTALQEGEGKTGKAVALQLHDLQGDIVGEANDNEAETKLLKTYNSTEFGVPSGKAPPPKYAWLGAAGVASELPSGVITQDGVTYVPQTGQPLQTQPVELPLPTNSDNPYVKENADGAEWGAIAGALRIAEYWKAQRAVAPEQGCNGDAGPCEGEDPGDLARGGCSVWTTIHFSTSVFSLNTVYAYGYFGCNTKVGHFEMQVCVQEETSTVENAGSPIESSTPNGKFANYGSDACTKGDKFSKESRGKIEASTSCENPARSMNYRSWVWGRTWGPGFNYIGWGVSAVRWSGSACEPTTHGPGNE